MFGQNDLQNVDTNISIAGPPSLAGNGMKN